MGEKLSKEAIERFLTRHQDWKLMNGKWLIKKYRFNDYLHGIQFVSEVGQLAESFQHHPYMTVNYKLVTVKLTTWSLGALTQTDLKMAVLFDEAFSKL